MVLPIHIYHTLLIGEGMMLLYVTVRVSVAEFDGPDGEREQMHDSTCDDVLMRRYI
jgi:hypothetical protein